VFGGSYSDPKRDRKGASDTAEHVSTGRSLPVAVRITVPSLSRYQVRGSADHYRVFGRP
jgi:hypothetical protein